MTEKLENIESKLIEILDSFNIGFNYKNLKFIDSLKYPRYDLCSINDLSMIKKFKNLTQTSNFISTDWEAYGRDLKITNLLIKLKQKKII